ncbi:MAG: nicotinate-nucleotide--dimethylbenzimidazole phosphoribosyltransferase [Chloroflexi bacterium]|nr:nicotinate-nucleotide--dimethylbenzimidazole phosphoribosyltransferase [Chloroflexota bacterium]
MSKILEKTLKAIKALDKDSMDKARQRQDSLTKPQGSLGRLEEISIQLAGIQGKEIPKIDKKAVIVMAGDHGILEEGIHNWPKEVTAQMVENFISGGACINVISRQIGADVLIVDMGVATPISKNDKLVRRSIGKGTKNIVRGAAMTKEQALKAIEAGIDIISKEAKMGLNLVGTGDMGLGNTSSSAAICAVITGSPVSVVTGRGTGLEDAKLKKKIEAIEKALEVNKADREDPMDVLAKLGGFEIAGLAGVILGAAANGVAVVIDGFISGAAALIATEIEPKAKRYIIGGHLSVEPGHRIMLDYMGVSPLLQFDMRLGEGTGGALAMVIVEASARTLGEMATFGEARVSEKEQ